MNSKIILVVLVGIIFVVLGFASATMALDTDREDSSNRISQERNSEMRMAMQSGDLDGDGIANCEDPDDDGDGTNDTLDEYPHDHDNDGIPDGKDDDDDNDGIPDEEDDEYVGNCSKPGRKFDDRKFHKGNHRKQKDQNRDFTDDKMKI